ncbi:MAG: hypothetical protein WCL38_01800, partial [Actinomycetota bacterium]
MEADVNRPPIKKRQRLLRSGVLALLAPLAWVIGLPVNAPVASASVSHVWRTTNFTPPLGSFEGASCAATTCMAVGQRFDGSTSMLSSTNSGATWKQDDSSFGKVFLTSVVCSAVLHCVAGGYKQYFTTTDGGRTWSSHLNPSAVQSLNTMNCSGSHACEATATSSNFTT